MKPIISLKTLLAAGVIGLAFPAAAQETGRPMTVEDLAAWQRITQKAITPDGQWVAYKMENWRGDAAVHLSTADGAEKALYSPAKDFRFSVGGNYLVVTETTGSATRDSLKLAKTKEDAMPMDRLVIRPTQGTDERIDSLRGYKLAEKADWLAYQQGRKDSTLTVRDLAGKRSFRFPRVQEYGFAQKSGILFFITKGDPEMEAGLYRLDPDKGQPVLIKAGDGVFKQTTLDEQGQHLAFLYCADKDSTDKSLDLWLSENGAPAKTVASRGDAAFPSGWVLNENGALRFSPSATRLFFGTSPMPRQKDTTTLDENRPNVQVWSWDEPTQYTVQSYNLQRDLKKTYQAVYLLAEGKNVQLADTLLPTIQLGNEGDGAWALLSTTRPYSLSSMWEGRTRTDYYKVNVATGERQPIAKADYTRFQLSPMGLYAYGYNATDSCWYTVDLADNHRYRLTSPQTLIAWDEQNDTPDYPRASGCPGWLKDDEAILLYDRYDIWRFAPKGAQPGVRLTKDGRERLTRHGLRHLDPEERSFDPSKPYIVTGFNEVTKAYGFYQIRLDRAGAPRPLLTGEFHADGLTKAREADLYLYTVENYETFPDLHVSGPDFKNSRQISHGIDQQKPFRWGTAEQVSWISLDGQPIEGIIYKPANFDPSKKYPMIVNFYERNAETLYDYHMPEPHRSTIDYRLYNSNGYIVFNPDIRYRDGYPGESCYNCLMPGVSMMIAKGYVDEKAIGAQGHSWGGYQVAYLATRTRLFAAIESGAPVVNMFSAYGGIRWGSGLARAFQYEHTQSRLGGTPWSTPDRYHTNSPLFTMDKVTTPILIMHNDADGHVPWYQGIEYFVAMKRLGKPCWLLNYTGEPHWPTKLPNKMDFQKRMYQFFDHFLRGAEAPKWMSEGLPAVDQPYELGY